MAIEPLTRRGFESALRSLRKSDPVLDDIVRRLGPPGWRRRQSGFPTLVRIILEQQVSLASGRAVYRKLRQHLPSLTPAGFLRQTDDTLRSLGFSRQKIRYCRILAETVKRGDLRLRDLEEMEDGDVRTALMQLTGIGRWTADIYLMEALKRPDVWPAGDLALAVAAQRVLKLKERPTPEKLDTLGKRWKPWRAIAARILWHQYLNGAF